MNIHSSMKLNLVLFAYCAYQLTSWLWSKLKERKNNLSVNIYIYGRQATYKLNPLRRIYILFRPLILSLQTQWFFCSRFLNSASDSQVLYVALSFTYIHEHQHYIYYISSLSSFIYIQCSLDPESYHFHFKCTYWYQLLVIGGLISNQLLFQFLIDWLPTGEASFYVFSFQIIYMIIYKR